MTHGLRESYSVTECRALTAHVLLTINPLTEKKCSRNHTDGVCTIYGRFLALCLPGNLPKAARPAINTMILNLHRAPSALQGQHLRRRIHHSSASSLLVTGAYYSEPSITSSRAYLLERARSIVPKWRCHQDSTSLLCKTF